MSDHATAVAVAQRLLTEQHMGGLSPSFLARHYAEETGLGRDETQVALTAAVNSGALVAFVIDGFPMVTTPDRLPAALATTTEEPTDD